MNLENQVRLLEMREQNPNDEINLVYDSTLLGAEAITQLETFCTDNRIIPVDAAMFAKQTLTEKERTLLNFYKDEISNLNNGGNLAVASDILRWVSPLYEYGTYTDFDFPVDTSVLPPTIEVAAPLLLNIGSLKMGKQEFILSNNDYVAIIDPKAAKEQLERVQSGIIEKLTQYDNDFIERTREQLQNNFFNRYILKFMNNRSESHYIAKSKELDKHLTSSRDIRNYIRQVMSDKDKYIDFSRKSHEESNEEVIQRLKNGLQNKLTLVKYLFFSKEYMEIKYTLQKDDDAILAYLMKTELNLYLKSIVVCTTGPIQISEALFGGYVFDSKYFIKNIQPFSFNHYNLQKTFKTQNSIPIHSSPLHMIRFLGKGEGELNDSSWLESGGLLQDMRIKKLEQRQQEFASSLPNALMTLKHDIEEYIIKLSRTQDGTMEKQSKINKEALEEVLRCFHQEKNENEFDVAQFQNIFTEFFHDQSKKPITDLEKLSRKAIIFGLTKNRKIKWHSPS